MITEPAESMEIDEMNSRWTDFLREGVGEPFGGVDEGCGGAPLGKGGEFGRDDHGTGGRAGRDGIPIGVCPSIVS